MQIAAKGFKVGERNGKKALKTNRAAKQAAVLRGKDQGGKYEQTEHDVFSFDTCAGGACGRVGRAGGVRGSGIHR